MANVSEEDIKRHNKRMNVDVWSKKEVVSTGPNETPLAFPQVTRVSVREARAAELKAEIVNSQKLAGYFKENAGMIRRRFNKELLDSVEGGGWRW